MFLESRFDELTYYFPPFAYSGAKIRVHCQNGFEDPESGVASVDKNQGGRRQIEKQFVRMLSFIDAFGSDHGGDRYFVESVEQLGYARHSGRVALFDFVRTEMFSDLLCIRESEHCSVFGEQAESMPRFRFESGFEQMHEMPVEFDERGKFELFTSLAQCGFRKMHYGGSPVAQNLEKRIQLNFVGILNDFDQKAYEQMEREFFFSGEIGYGFFVAVRKFLR